MGGYLGLILAWSKGCREMVLEVDSKLVVRWLQIVKFSNMPMSNLIQKCKQELKKQWLVVIVHAYRESNHATDMLANAAATLQCNRGLRVLEDPPSKLTYILMEDVVGFPWPRKVPVVNS